MIGKTAELIGATLATLVLISPAFGQAENPVNLVLAPATGVNCQDTNARSLAEAGEGSPFKIPQGQQLIITDVHGALLQWGRAGDGVDVAIGPELTGTETADAVARIVVYGTLDPTGSTNLSANLINGAVIKGAASDKAGDANSGLCVWFHYYGASGDQSSSSPSAPNPGGSPELFVNGYLQVMAAH